MTQTRPHHPPTTLLGRTEDELHWPQRRSLLQAAAAWATAGAHAAWAQQEQAPTQAPPLAPGNVVEVRGEVLRNGAPLAVGQVVTATDRIETAPGSSAVFTVGNGAFLVRANTKVQLEGEAPTAVRALRLLTGAVASVWGKGAERKIITPTMTAGIRGTGVYTEVFPEQDLRSYFCNCYGVVDLDAGGERLVSESSYHQAFWGEPEARSGRLLTPAGAINHTDEELEFLASLIQQRTAWQIAGRKGSKDGRGALYNAPAAPGGASRNSGEQPYGYGG